MSRQTHLLDDFSEVLNDSRTDCVTLKLDSDCTKCIQFATGTFHPHPVWNIAQPGVEPPESFNLLERNGFHLLASAASTPKQALAESRELREHYGAGNPLVIGTDRFRMWRGPWESVVLDTVEWVQNRVTSLHSGVSES